MKSIMLGNEVKMEKVLDILLASLAVKFTLKYINFLIAMEQSKDDDLLHI